MELVTPTLTNTLVHQKKIRDSSESIGGNALTSDLNKMAEYKPSSGDLRHKVVFKQPTSSLNDEGGKEVSYTEAFTTWAAVKAFNMHRTTEANATALIGALDFYVRYSADRAAITKEWLINYNSKEYVIHEIEPIDQLEKFIRFTAKTKG